MVSFFLCIIAYFIVLFINATAPSFTQRPNLHCRKRLISHREKSELPSCSHVDSRHLRRHPWQLLGPIQPLPFPTQPTLGVLIHSVIKWMPLIPSTSNKTGRGHPSSMLMCLRPHSLPSRSIHLSRLTSKSSRR